LQQPNLQNQIQAYLAKQISFWETTALNNWKVGHYRDPSFEKGLYRLSKAASALKYFKQINLLLNLNHNLHHY